MEGKQQIVLSEADLGRASLELALLYLTRAGQTPSAVPASLIDQVAQWVSDMWDRQPGGAGREADAPARPGKKRRKSKIERLYPGPT
jgi:hypothetical protein